MTCSVLIPSRARPKRLFKTIRSLQETAKRDVEILVRLDDDDAASLAIVSQLDQLGVVTRIGPRKAGYASLASFYEELAAVASRPWIWIMNDDAYVKCTAKAWDAQLKRLPTTGLIVQPEWYQLNSSKYQNCEGGAFPIVPNGSWRQLGQQQLADPIDTWLDQVLHLQGGWTTHFLKDVWVVHERDTDDVLAVHRQIS